MDRNIGLLAVSVLAAAYIAGGCGGTGSDPTTEGYFRRVAEVGVEFDERLEELRFEPDLDSDVPPLDQVNEFFDEVVLVNSEYVEALAEIDAPPEVAKEHAELVAAVTDVTNVVTRLVGRWDTVSEAQQFIEQGFDESDPELRDASQRFEAACAALREAAIINNISSQVEC